MDPCANTSEIIVPTLSDAPISKPKDPITCHVLDLTSGLPAANIAVSLTLLRPRGSSAPFLAVTNSDGRISNWNAQDGPSLISIFEKSHVEPSDGRMVWELVFQTGEYFGEGGTFFPEVRVRFFVEVGEGKDGQGENKVQGILS
ncbi:MAG: hypothetical protein Q9163_001552 [Psora crenata]